MAAEKVQLISDLVGIVRVAKANSSPVDLGTLVGLFWGMGGVYVGLFEPAMLMVPGEDTLIRISGTTLQFLDSATGTIEYARLEVPDIGA